MQDDSSVTHPVPPTTFQTGVALFLDLDGTVVDFARRPDEVTVAPELLSLLSQLQAQCGGALALVTGRALESVDRLLAPLVLPAAGLHGAQLRWAAGPPPSVRPMPGHVEVVRALKRLADKDNRLLVEDKIASVALHYREAPERADECNAFLRGLGGERGLDVVVGNCIVEARAPGINKGTAIRDFLAHAPFAGRTPVFVGDDTTDEDGFSLINDRQGVSVKVGPGTSRAQFRLESIAAVHQWLTDVVQAQKAGGNHGRSKRLASDGPAG